MNRIFYFSGTGNSLAVARDIAASLGDTELVSMAERPVEACDSNIERIGFIFPVYAWGPPAIVCDFAEKLELPRTSYLFAIATYGGFPAATLRIFDGILKRKGRGLSAGFGIRMPGNYTPLYGAQPQEKLKKVYEDEKRSARAIAEAAKDRKPGAIAANNPLVNLLFSRFIYRGFRGALEKADKSFWTDEKCNGCGVCARVCPVRNIEMRDGRPAWLGKCQQCVACLQWCPQEAVQYGKKTPGRRRYRNPDVSVGDFFRKKDS